MRARSLVLIALGLATAGCSDSSAPQAPRAAATATARVDSPAEAEVRSVSQRFMQAVVRGDSAEARRWLTPVAAQNAAANPDLLATIGYPVESLAIGEVRLVSPEEAAAQCLLSEAGAAEPQEVGCLLKLAPEGWRVCGLACDGGPGQPPILVGFEGQPGPSPTPNNVVEDPYRSEVPQTAVLPAGTERR